MSQYYSQDALRYTIRSIALQNKLLKIHDGQYQIEKQLGAGGFGTVYAARRSPDNKPVAIKVISLATMNPFEAKALNDSILNEVAMAKRLEKTSQHIVHMHDFDFHPKTGLAFIVMERGLHDLEKALQLNGRLEGGPRKVIWRQLVTIAMTLHSRDIVHLDIKPQNILVFPNSHIKLIDMGIAQKADTRNHGPSGTIPYSAPEVTRPTPYQMAKNTSVADAWSWGAILYRMAYLRPPAYERVPCHHPPQGVKQSRDDQLVDVLKHTLVLNPANRKGPTWLSAHQFTLTQ